jgi:integrase
MARKINRLNAGAVGTITKYGRHADGGGLYLSISPNGGRRWIFLFRWHGKPTEIGFGSARDVTLLRARELRAWARTKLAEGINPKYLKRPSEVTFGECADRVIEAMRPSWRNGKHAAQWEMTLRDYAAPLGHLPVGKITTDDVLSVLKPLWNEKPETASRLRGRIERVLDAAKAQGLRRGENPARWRRHLDQLLPKRKRLTRGHHAAMGYNGLPAFMADLQAWQATAALALEFAILTAARSGEVLGARWDEFDLDRAVWTIPATRMKAGREHRVPLSERALKIAKAMREGRNGEFVFPGRKRQAIVRHGARNSAPSHQDRRYCGRLSLHFQKLGSRAHQFSERGLQRGTCPHDGEQGRDSRSAWGSIRQTSQVDGDLGIVLRHTSGNGPHSTFGNERHATFPFRHDGPHGAH